ncbi:laccase domain-containing protein 1-like [Mizuhopecten yessoensis]|uniref:Laccase domain-containing protein 1 n=1 Tax=Mizuhopecten yessoensis TaxID=6573 RepID=A0A210QDX9_MIZYE|nr:laccase domain-containing protein 1-like [Mizuhopecten yessoensis]OWF46945.1 Laccase domain-containing protein 1 [Mizuhopecten yessoensis]
MAGTERTYMLDLWTEQHCNDVVEKILSLPPTENSSVLLLASDSSQSDSVKTALGKQNHDKVVQFGNKDKIAVFYDAKLYLDKHGLCAFSVLCSNRHVQYWRLLLTRFITNVYEWKIITVDQQETEVFTEEQITKDVSNFFGSQTSAFGDVSTLTSPIIPTDLFYHGFSCRTGGLSSLPGMKSLNLVFSQSKRDPKALVQENRRKLAKHVGFDPEQFRVASAVHGNCVLVVGEQEPEGYDGIATDRLGTTLGAPGADCVTMIFADPVKRACAALHSGWMGTVKRACVEVIHKMATAFGTNPADICVAMGPSIGQCCFEFDADKIGQFNDIVEEAAVVSDDGLKAFVNLQLCNRVLLEQNGVKPNNIDDKSCTKCTSCNSELFFSYRRDGRPFGNQLGFIGMRM